MKKTFTILGISIWRILVYLIIYSVLGYVIETLFGIVIVSRFSQKRNAWSPIVVMLLGIVILFMFIHLLKALSGMLVIPSEIITFDILFL